MREGKGGNAGAFPHSEYMENLTQCHICEPKQRKGKRKVSKQKSSRKKFSSPRVCFFRLRSDDRRQKVRKPLRKVAKGGCRKEGGYYGKKKEDCRT